MSSTTHAFVFPAHPGQLEQHVSELERALPIEFRIDEVRAGLVETLGNAIIHGALGLSSVTRDAGDLEAYFDAVDEAASRLADTRRVEVVVMTNGRDAEIVITDPGPGFDWRKAPRGRGLGISIIHQVFSAVRWNEAGNAITLVLKAQ